MKALVLSLTFCSSLLFADRTADVRGQVVYVTSALASRNPTDAMGPFDKSFKNYAKLADYFNGLTQAFEVSSEVEVKDQEDGDTGAKLLVTWQLTLTDPVSNSTTRRTADVSLTLALREGKWKIVDMSPIEIFNPQQAR